MRRDLAATEAKDKVEYGRAVLEVTDNYRDQMLAVKDTIWESSWVRLLHLRGAARGFSSVD